MRHLLDQFVMLIILSNHDIGADEDLEFTSVDVAKLATHIYGTELLLLESSHYTDQQSYKLEDFFWTGSGDGPTEENVWTSEEPSIIYKTSTIISTVFVETPATTQANESSARSSNCTLNCSSAIPGGQIIPTPTLNGDEESATDNDLSTAREQFWLLTVLKSDGKDPVIIDLKNSLAKLYKTAFQRQQEQHLGIVARSKRAASASKPVNVYIHEVNRQTIDGEDKIEVLYHVEMLGKPVDAHTAATDMKLLSDEEVVRELGYPFEIKAEPYVKASQPQELSKAKNTWFVIGVSIIGLLLILLVLAFALLGFTKKKRLPQPNVGLENRRHIFERAVGHENKGLVQDDETLSESQQARKDSPTYINFADQHVTSVVLRPQSSFSATSSSSSSLDISPLMNVEKKHKPPPKKPPRPRAALNKTVPVNNTRQLPPEVFDSDSSLSRKDESPDFPTNMDPGVISPKSFLSMPSVKSFPRTNMPEPLNKVLEPVSVTHLDMPDDGGISARDERKYGSESLIRHGSIGTMEDPGVIGPIVWNKHSDRLKQGVSVDQGMNELRDQLKASTNISRMRKRFHDLLDDTFSLFGNSRKGSPTDSPVDDRSRPIAIEVKSHSAYDNRPLDIESTLRPRPKTSGSSKPPSSKPSCAWSSTTPSPLIRPLSAAPRITTGASSRAVTLSGEHGSLPKTPSGILKHPRVNVEHVLAEGRFRPSDPAISVIQAIKSEIEKVSLPGSSSDLDK